MVRRILGRTVVLTLFASVFSVAPGAAADDPGEPMLTFVGGGWGHGIGLSQHGAYGRAMAGHSYDEIIEFYYHDSAIGPVGDFAGFESGGDVDVLIGVRDVVAVSTPVVGGGPEPGWEVTVKAGDTVLGTSTRPVTARYLAADESNPARWSAQYTDAADPTELCTKACRGDVVLTIERTGGTHVVVEESENGANLGKYGHGTIVLHPAAVGSPSKCGTDQDFCIVNADMTLDEYLYGLAEVPSSWPTHALRAQAVAGRSFAAATIRDRAGWGEPFDLYDSTSDQVFTGWERSSACDGQSWCAAVDATSGEIVVHNGTIAKTFYSSSNGGHTAVPPDVWEQGATLGYLKARPDPFDDNPANPNGRWEHTYPVADVSRWLNDYDDPDQGDQLHVGSVERIIIEDVPASGRINFALVTIHGSEKSVEVRRNGDPYGVRFFAALRNGCTADAAAGADCDALLGTKFVIITFADVALNAWYYGPVQWMTAEDLTTGTGPNEFSPTQSNSRAELAVFLWRLAGRPDPTRAHGFTDVEAGSWYEDAVAWLAESGFTTGTSPTEFSPRATITRAQAATMLWRFAGAPKPTAPNRFDDVAAGRFYTQAVRWMIEFDLTTGTSPTTFSPDEPLTRAQIATFLWRLAGKPEAFAKGIDLPDAMRVP